VNAPQCVSSATVPSSPTDFGFQGSSNAAKKKTLMPQPVAPQMAFFQ
jgi:hypothetical protein